MKNHPNRCVRKNFDKNGGVICKECFQRDLLLDSLREELKAAKIKIHQLEQRKKQKISKKDLDEPHAPPASKKFKTNSSMENQAKTGGAKFGHKGSGRNSENASDEQKEIPCPLICPCCQIPLASKDSVKRTVVDVDPPQARRKTFTLKRGQCPSCRKTFKGPAAVLPRGLYGNQLLSQALVMHYVHGISIGRVLEIFGSEVTKGGLINSFHSFGKLCAPAREILIEKIKTENVRNADETGWRTDGQSGFAWIFRSEKITIFEHCDSRGSKIPRAIFGEKTLDGFLVVDRYNAYNKIPVKIQYCYAHLLREVVKLEKEYAQDQEIKRFVTRMSSLLAEAMGLQKLTLTTEQYFVTAKNIKQAIIKEINYPYTHLSIRYIVHRRSSTSIFS